MPHPNDILLTGHVAMITGGGQGLGEAMGRAFARFGAKVVLLDRKQGKAAAVAKSLEDEGYEALGLETDVRDTPQVEQALQATLDRFGQVDILVNNAAGVRQTPFIKLDTDKWRRQIETNFGALFTPTEVISREMVRAGRGGNILNITSIEGLRAAPLFAAYAACKAGMVSLTRTLAIELSDHDIRVNCLAPDIIDTPGINFFSEGQQGFTTNEAFERYIPLKRVGTPEEFASAAIFLCSKMASYITGVTLSVDGGTFAASGWSRSPSREWTLVHPHSAPAVAE
ncbi:SDR family NAD(P)-dependent oxidoreductase [Sphingosinicella soli]|uniref:SDR family NAD(P)-dependent oxidoreductase n=1 Tax=Sphingosinicella soli TaxID=333708 RepID=UPI0016115A65|nr:SDR family NAD(P)-dependent oxidoreductase [Sphingosinicella soli]